MNEVKGLMSVAGINIISGVIVFVLLGVILRYAYYYAEPWFKDMMNSGNIPKGLGRKKGIRAIETVISGDETGERSGTEWRQLHVAKDTDICLVARYKDKKTSRLRQKELNLNIQNCNGKSIQVGRYPNSNLRLPSYLKRNHREEFLIIKDQDQFYLRTRHSNLTYLSGMSIPSDKLIPIREGMKLRCKNVTYEFLLYGDLKKEKSFFRRSTETQI